MMREEDGELKVTVSSLLPLLQCSRASLLFAKLQDLYPCCAWREFRQQGKGQGEQSGKSEIRAAPQQGNCSGWESQPHPPGSTGRSEVPRKQTEREAASKGASTYFSKNQEVHCKKKGFSLLLHKVFCLPLKMTLEKKRQGWKGTQKKVRLLPRELKRRWKSQHKSAANASAFGKDPLPGVLEPGLVTLLIIPWKKIIESKGIHWKATQRPSFPLLSIFIPCNFSGIQ